MTTSTVKPSAQTAFTSGVAAETIATGSNSVVSDTLDNSGATRYGYLSGEIVYQYSVAPTAGKNLNLYVERAKDGSNFEDASPNNGWLMMISPAADTDSHRVALPVIPLMPEAVRLRIVNVDTAQTVTVTLNLYTHSDTIES